MSTQARSKFVRRKRPAKIARNILSKLARQAAELRQAARINAPGALLFRADMGAKDRTVLVEADGCGGATLLIVEGNYPLDFLTLYERGFRTERSALNAAHRIK